MPASAARERSPLPVNDGPAPIAFGRSVCGDLASAERREWVVTNGLGGFASGTVAGTLTRRYHGLLLAALAPPGGRTLLATKFEEVVDYAGGRFELGTNRWASGAIAPRGYTSIERFALSGTSPVWTYGVADALLEKRLWMEHGANTTYVRYAHVRGKRPLRLTLRALGTYRNFYTLARAEQRAAIVEPVERGVRVDFGNGARPYFIVADRGGCAPHDEWYRGFLLAEETERGEGDVEDHLCVAEFEVDLTPGESVAFVLSDAEPGPIDAAAAWERKTARETNLLGSWLAAQPEATEAPAWLRRCVVAADQFVVAHPRAGDPGALSVIAGYPWFGTWGRDTMIALKGLTLATGRPEIAAKILATFAAFVEEGMLPNDFPDNGETPEYNTVDAALWFIEAVAAYVEATGEHDLLAEVWPKLEQIVAAYRDGTRFGIKRDPADGLIAAGVPGVQITWMDAKVGDWVVTPRIGKPVEIAALWYNALERLTELAPLAGADPQTYAKLASEAKRGFGRFWNAERGFLYDVLDGPDGHDPSLRPNQLFAVSLPFSPLEPPQQRAVVDTCARHLLASTGLRSLAPGDPAYLGRYAGSQRDRDAAYHQGTSWMWLLGAFSTAYARAYSDAAGARAFLDAYCDALVDGAVGTLGEIADGDPPFTPRGAFAQAWSVAEAIRAWHEAPRFAKRGMAAAYYVTPP